MVCSPDSGMVGDRRGGSVWEEIRLVIKQGRIQDFGNGGPGNC